jgi:hypothetical protein
MPKGYQKTWGNFFKGIGKPLGNAQQDALSANVSLGWV